MRFLVDMPLSPELADWLTRQGHDAVHTLLVGLDRASDDVILERARGEQRVVVTADLDYPRLLALAQAEGPYIETIDLRQETCNSYTRSDFCQICEQT